MKDSFWKKIFARYMLYEGLEYKGPPQLNNKKKLFN